VVAGDIDPVAVETALANLEANGMDGQVACVEAAGLDSPAFREEAPFDLILANILKGPLLELAPDIAGAVAPNGRVVLSGLLREQAADVLEAYARQGLGEAHREEIGDWAILTLSKSEP
jgi:ribosomal protein L11 methyltransferase